MTTFERIIFEKIIDNKEKIFFLETEIKNFKNKIPPIQEKAKQKMIDFEKSKVGTSGKGNASLFHHFQSNMRQIESFNKEISERQNEINILKIFNSQQLEEINEPEIENFVSLDVKDSMNTIHTIDTIDTIDTVDTTPTNNTIPLGLGGLVVAGIIGYFLLRGK
jgi:hypothetical protein